MRKIVLGSLLLVGSLFAEQIYATFDVEADKSAKVAFDSSGIIDSINVEIGSIVKKAEQLASLKNSDIKAMLEVHKTTLKFAKKDFDRQVQIKNLIDEAKFDSFANSYENAKAQVAYQKTLLDKTYLKAPFDGVIISKDVEVGDVVTPQTVKTAFKIQSLNKRKLILEFDQKYHNQVKVGDTYTYKLDGDIKEYKGKITKVYPYADTKTRKIGAEVITTNMLVGLFGDGYIESSK